MPSGVPFSFRASVPRRYGLPVTILESLSGLSIDSLGRKASIFRDQIASK
jgi:hypothetical protein